MSVRTSALIVLGVALCSVLLHWALGWQWTMLAGLGVGVWRPRVGWILGGVATALSWAGVVILTAAVTPASFRILLDTLGALAGNIPGETFVGLTVLLGGLLGALGGAVGGLARPLFPMTLGSAG